MKSLIFVGAMLALGSYKAQAADGCQSPRNQYDKTYCMAKLFMESDKELNEVYQDMRGQLKPEQKEKLKTVQLKWIKHRDDRCSAAHAIMVDCNFDVNRKRAEFLRDRLRECKTGHCREDLIYNETF